MSGELESTETLAARLQVLDRDARALRLASGNARKRCQRAAVVPPVAASAARRLALVLDDAGRAARDFLEKRCGVERAGAFLHHLLAWRESLDAATVELLLQNPPTQADALGLQAAQRFVSDRKLHDWVRAANMQSGIAPLPSLTPVQPAAGAEVHAPAKRPPSTTARRERQWLRRWRRRANVSLKRIPVMDAVPESARRRKATGATGGVAGHLGSPHARRSGVAG